jgi:hypothetical protein
LIDSEFKNKIGQMIMVGFKEAELAKDSPVVRAIKDFSLGGVILYNIDLKCYLEEQKKNPSLTRDEAARLCPSVEKVIVVKRTGQPVPMKEGRDLWLSSLLEGAEAFVEPEAVESSHGRVFAKALSVACGKAAVG